MRLAYGTVQRRGTLDHFIERLAQRPSARLDRVALAALRLGAYELCYLDGAPDHAIVDDGVQLAREGGSAGHGLVNAVLRRCARERGELLTALGEETPERAATMHSHPQWLAAMWWRELGAAEACALMAADNEPDEVAIRVNTLVSDADTVAAALPVPSHRDEALPEALVLEGPLDLPATAPWSEGAIVAQSRAAMRVAHVLDPQPGERVLELCAAPGGKTSHVAALMGGTGSVLAVEHHAGRARALEDTLARVKASNVDVRVGDAAGPVAADQSFDRVLVDPPCSGLGVLQGRADLRWRASPQRIAAVARSQRQILAAGACALRPGGVLVYSTCTISTAENERQIEALISTQADLAVDDVVRTFPHRDRTAGFFIARLRRSG
jgi:16S rRNA (cytosine967-C5)-methyltransferase